MQEQLYNDQNANQNAISQVQRFLDLNEKHPTGGMIMNAGGALLSDWNNSGYSEMQSLSKDATLAKLGGSLGVAISDGDRKFILSGGLNVGAPFRRNQNVGRAMIGALNRQNDFKYHFAMAQMQGDQMNFQKNWKLFVDSTPIVKYDQKGDVVSVNNEPPTYEEWLNNRPKYDAQGRKIN
jgi:hypothetical protein